MYQKNFFSLMLRAKPLPFYLEKVVFLVFFFFFTKDLIYLVHLIHFLLLLSLIFSKQSLLLCFWRDSWWVCSLNYLVILSNYDFSLLIVRKCQCSCVFHALSHFHFVSFNSRFRSFLVDIFFWSFERINIIPFKISSKKFIFHCFSRCFQKTLIFHLFCNCFLIP